MKRLALGIAVAGMVLAGAGYAAEQLGPASQPETRAEAQARAGRLFDKLDLNHDGKLDQADRAARTGEMFDRLDSNHDGAISRQEFGQAHDHGDPADGAPDGDGPDHPGMDHPAMAGGHPGGHMGHWGYDHRQMHGLVTMIMQRSDPGHAGVVTRDAFVAAALALFDQADTNHDGVLTPAEHRAFAQVMRQQMRGDWQHGGPGGDMPPPPAH